MGRSLGVGLDAAAAATWRHGVSQIMSRRDFDLPCIVDAAVIVLDTAGVVASAVSDIACMDVQLDGMMM